MSSGHRGEWSGKIGFIIAAASSAIGLGNIWRFPYLVGMNGGAAFVVVYVAIVATVGISVLLAEFCLGRATRRNAVGAFNTLSTNPFWRLIGWLCMLVGGVIILSYYGVVAGWTIKYAIHSLTGLMPIAAAGGSEQVLNDFFADSKLVILFQVIAMFISTSIVAAGVSQGIEKACKILMPALFILLIVLIVRGVTLDGAAKGLSFYLAPDFSKLTGKAFLDALGQSFYSISIAMGIMITYGSYAKKEDDLVHCGFLILILDTLVAILAGFAIFPAVFAMGIEPTAGVGLSFVTLPAVFASMPAGGALFSCAFFLLLAVAAITSTMSLIEVLISFLIDEFALTRKKAVWVGGCLVTALGIPSAISLSGSCNIFGMPFFDFFDSISNNLIMPVTAIGISIFVGWKWSESAKAEITNNGQIEFTFFHYWMILLRFVTPVMIALILFNGWPF